MLYLCLKYTAMKTIIISESAKSKINNSNYGTVIEIITKSKTASGKIGNIIYNTLKNKIILF
jgi:hypothetical protein